MGKLRASLRKVKLGKWVAGVILPLLWVDYYQRHNSYKRADTLTNSIKTAMVKNTESTQSP